LLIGSLCIPLLHVAVMQPKLLFTDFIGCTWKVWRLLWLVHPSWRPGCTKWTGRWFPTRLGPISMGCLFQPMSSWFEQLVWMILMVTSNQRWLHPGVVKGL
jgi:hypothetical protein